MGRTGNREAAAAAALQQDVQVLAGLKAKGFNRGQAQQDLHDVARERGEARDSAGECFDLDVGYGRNEARFDHEVCEGSCLTQKNMAGLLFGGGETRGAAVGVPDFPCAQPCAT